MKLENIFVEDLCLIAPKDATHISMFIGICTD